MRCPDCETPLTGVGDETHCTACGWPDDFASAENPDYDDEPDDYYGEDDNA